MVSYCTMLLGSSFGRTSIWSLLNTPVETDTYRSWTRLTKIWLPMATILEEMFLAGDMVVLVITISWSNGLVPQNEKNAQMNHLMNPFIWFRLVFQWWAKLLGRDSSCGSCAHGFLRIPFLPAPRRFHSHRGVGPHWLVWAPQDKDLQHLDQGQLLSSEGIAVRVDEDELLNTNYRVKWWLNRGQW